MDSIQIAKDYSKFMQTGKNISISQAELSS